jgi:ferredoxin
MTFIPTIDDSACLAHGDCAELAPDVFRLDDVATVIGTAPLERLVEIAQSCPAAAIAVVDDETGEPAYP